MSRVTIKELDRTIDTLSKDITRLEAEVTKQKRANETLMDRVTNSYRRRKAIVDAVRGIWGTTSLYEKYRLEAEHVLQAIERAADGSGNKFMSCMIQMQRIQLARQIDAVEAQIVAARKILDEEKKEDC